MDNKYVLWSDDFLIGDETIDRDHRLFIDAINSLYTALDGDAGFATIETLLCKIADLSIENFAYEERLMDGMRFPFRDKHRAEHSGFLRALDEMVLSYENRELASIRARVDSLRDRFIFHVLNFDLLLRAYLVDSGRTGNPGILPGTRCGDS